MRSSRWKLILPLGLSTILSLTGDLTLYATLPIHAEAVGLSLAQVGILLSANRFVRILSNPLAGFLLDRGRRRPIYIYGMVLGTLSTLMYALFHQFWILLFGRLLWGLAWSFIHVGGNTMIVDTTTNTDRGRYLGVLRSLTNIGLSVNPLLGAFLADQIGLRPGLLVCASLTGLGLVLAFFSLPETHRSEDLLAGESQPVLPLEVTRSFNGRWTTMFFQRMVVNWQSTAAILLFFIIMFAGNGLMMSTIGLFLKDRYGTEIPIENVTIGIATLTGFLLAYRSGLVAVSAPIAGAISDRNTTRWRLIPLAVLIGITGMTILATVQRVAGTVLGVSLIAISEGVLLTVLPAIIGDISRESQRGKLLSSIFVAGDLGSATAPLLVYLLLSLMSLSTVYLISAVSLGFGLLTLIAIRELAKSRWALVQT